MLHETQCEISPESGDLTSKKQQYTILLSFPELGEWLSMAERDTNPTLRKGPTICLEPIWPTFLACPESSAVDIDV